MNSPPLPPPAPQPQSQQAPIPVLPLTEPYVAVRSAGKPYQRVAAASWIIPIVSLAFWVLFPRRGAPRLDAIVTGVAHLGFVLGLLLGIVAIIGISRRGGSMAPAIVGVLLNGFLLFAAPR